MPTKCGKRDSKGVYCQWGNHGAHYYYTPGDKESMERARKKADAQGAAAHASGWHGGEGGELMGEIEEKKLPDVNPNEDEQTYVSRCIAFETEHSPDRSAEQISRMCYEKYREAIGGHSPPEVKSIDELSAELIELKKSLEELKKGLI